MKCNWNDIPEERPDNWDLDMLKDVDDDPACHEFVSAEEAKRLLEGMNTPLEECDPFEWFVGQEPILTDERKSMEQAHMDRMNGDVYTHEEVWG